jgi:hypothetical protein
MYADAHSGTWLRGRFCPNFMFVYPMVGRDANDGWPPPRWKYMRAREGERKQERRIEKPE